MFEEERRLFYVAMTRAQNELYLFDCRNQKSSFTMPSPSSFNASSIRCGSIVDHPSFEMGVVMLVQDNIADILFDNSNAVKRFELNLCLEMGCKRRGHIANKS